MKKLLCLMTLLGLAITANSQLTNNIVSYWKFDGNARDTLGINNCSVTGAIQTTGKLGNCYSFDGNNDYLEAVHSSSLNISGSVSISAWVKTNSNTSNLWIIGKPPSASSHIAPWKSYGIHIDHGVGMLPGIVVTTSGVHNGANSDVGIEMNQWYHLVGVYDGSSVKIYVNGVLKGQSSKTGSITTYITPLRIGINGGLSEDFNGLIDEVGIWGRALTESDVIALYNGGVGLSYPFSTTTYTLTVSASPTAGGTIGLSPAGGSYASGTTVTATATAASGYTFAGWSGAVTGTTNPGTVIMNANKTLTATFTPTTTYSLTITAPTNGTITASPVGPNYTAGTTVTLTANPASGYQLSGWTGAISGITNPTTLIMNGNKTVSATFTPLPSGSDNLGNHTATQNIKLGSYWLSSDGGNEGIRVNNNGNVGIGTANPDPASKLTVNGKILAKEVEVVSSIASDYVFEPEYQLMPLTELEHYLKQHKHLPGIPSAAEFAKSGQNLAKTDDLLLRKIEELTLYILQLKKENENLRELNTQVQKLRAEMDQLKIK